MEGPSLKVVADRLDSFKGKIVLSASGNARIEKSHLFGQKIKKIFTVGKILIIQFSRFSLKLHFLMFGSYRINEKREGMEPRLSLQFDGGQLNFYSCSVRMIENKEIKKMVDEEVDILSPKWKPQKVQALARKQKKELICDVLLDQDIYAGVGNIIKNEALFLSRIHPLSIVGKIPPGQLKKLTQEARQFSRLFYETRRSGYLIAGIQKIYRKKQCPLCHGKVIMKKTGHRHRMSHFCPQCQVLYG
jgi:endonuclease-8